MSTTCCAVAVELSPRAVGCSNKVGRGGKSKSCSEAGPIPDCASRTSLDATRVLILFGLLLPLGASRCLERGRSRALLAVFLAVSAINAGASILEALGVFEPFAIESIAGRVTSVGFLGNEGYLALLMALAAVVSLGVALHASNASIRAAAWSALVLFLIALAFTRDVTGWIALAVGALPFVRERLVSGRSRAWVAAAMLALIAGSMATVALFGRGAGLVQKAEAGELGLAAELSPNPMGRRSRDGP